MKNISSLIYPKLPAVALLLVLSVLLGSCDRSGQPDVMVASDYFIQRIDSEIKLSTSVNTAQTVYSYDDSRNLVRTAYCQHRYRQWWTVLLFVGQYNGPATQHGLHH